MANQASNNVKYLLATKVTDFLNDTFKIILMESGFVFDPDTHQLYANVLANELPTLYGYTQGTKTLAGVSVVIDYTDNRCEITWNPVTWTASGGNIGPSAGAIIYDETVAGDPIIGYIDFLTEYTQVDGGTATLTAIEVRLS